jgi:hypothetical protein
MIVDQLLLLGYCLLILGGLLLARLPAAGHGANNCAGSGTRSGVSRDRTDGSPTGGSPGSAAKSLTAAYGWTRLLRWRARSDYCRIDTRSLLCPGVTLRVILFLLLYALALGGIHDRLLRRRRDCGG